MLSLGMLRFSLFVLELVEGGFESVDGVGPLLFLLLVQEGEARHAFSRHQLIKDATGRGMRGRLRLRVSIAHLVQDLVLL